MTISFSILNKNRSILGFEVTKSGNIDKGEGDSIIINNTIEVTLGLIFVFLTLAFPTGQSITIHKFTDDFKQKAKDILNKEKK